MASFNPVVWFEIYADDLQRARKFYETVLGIQLEALPVPGDMAEGGLQMMAFPSQMENGGASGALCHMDGIPAGVGGTLVYFHCEDCAVEASRVPGAGGKLHREKMSIGEYGHIALAFDTEGNMIGLHSMQ